MRALGLETNSFINRDGKERMGLGQAAQNGKSSSGALQGLGLEIIYTKGTRTKLAWDKELRMGHMAMQPSRFMGLKSQVAWREMVRKR